MEIFIFILFFQRMESHPRLVTPYFPKHPDGLRDERARALLPVLAQKRQDIFC